MSPHYHMEAALLDGLIDQIIRRELTTCATWIKYTSDLVAYVFGALNSVDKSVRRLGGNELLCSMFKNSNYFRRKFHLVMNKEEAHAMKLRAISMENRRRGNYREIICFKDAKDKKFNVHFC